LVSIDEHVCRLWFQLRERIVHRAQAGLENVDLVNEQMVAPGNRIPDFRT
jgi:hypothetical protein